jgi:replicative DNA helicase
MDDGTDRDDADLFKAGLLGNKPSDGAEPFNVLANVETGLGRSAARLAARLPLDVEHGAAPVIVPGTELANALDGMAAASVDARRLEREKTKTLERLERLERDAPKVGSFVNEAVARMKAREDGTDQPIPLPWPTLAERMGDGLWPGLTLLVGSPGSGKSQLALQVAIHAAKKGTPVLYIGLELGEMDLVARCLGLLAGVKWSEMYLGKTPVPAHHVEALRELPLRLAVAPVEGWSYHRLRPLARALREQADESGGGPMLVVVDYLQLVAAPEADAGMSLQERISRVGYAGRAVARDMDAAVLMISSASRENYAALQTVEKGNQPWERPAAAMVGLGKQSGDLEYAADNVLALAKESWTGDRAPSEGTHMHLAVAKMRAGTPGWVELRFDGGRFTEPEQGRVDI